MDLDPAPIVNMNPDLTPIVKTDPDPIKASAPPLPGPSDERNHKV